MHIHANLQYFFVVIGLKCRMTEALTFIGIIYTIMTFFKIVKQRRCLVEAITDWDDILCIVSTLYY